MHALTEIQDRVFEFVRERLENSQPAPTSREVASHFHWKSKRAAECHLEAIIKKGWLTIVPGQARGLRMSPRLMKRRNRVVDVPIFGSIPAGSPQSREQEAEGFVRVDVDTINFKPTRNTFALRVTGDSMVGRHICDGDIVILEHGAEARNGQIVAALIDGEDTLKTLVIKGGKPYLKAENPKYPNLIPAGELMIQGVFKALIRRAES